MKIKKVFAAPRLIVILAMFSAPLLHAQIYVVDSQLNAQPDDGIYDYTLTLNNRDSSTTQIGTFWFAWTDSGEDLLLSSPTVTQTPSDWLASVSGGSYTDYYGNTYYDGYSIQFTTASDYLNPGSSLTFQFTSPDSPADISGDNPNFGIAIKTSFVYSGGPFSDAGNEFLVQTVPEPGAFSLLVVGGLAIAIARYKNTPKPG